MPAIVQQGSPGVPSAARTMLPSQPDSITVSSTDVTRRAAEVFGESAAVIAPAVADATAAAPTWDIEVRSYESTDRVEHYVQLVTGPAREHIVSRLQRGTRYEPMIRATLRAGGLPEDMYYLAFVESGFDPNAYSRAAAVGMWQFMTSTARDMGMRVDWWVDERRDPMKSTVAAVRFIKELKQQFGSRCTWPLRRTTADRGGLPVA
jgi:membrane-bound lytic murein transglycosylase D